MTRNCYDRRYKRPWAEIFANLIVVIVMVAVFLFVLFPSIRTQVGDFLSIPFAVETEYQDRRLSQ